MLLYSTDITTVTCYNVKPYVISIDTSAWEKINILLAYSMQITSFIFAHITCGSIVSENINSYRKSLSYNVLSISKFNHQITTNMDWIYKPQSS